jgi:hypothetical protein
VGATCDNDDLDDDEGEDDGKGGVLAVDQDLVNGDIATRLWRVGATRDVFAEVRNIMASRSVLEIQTGHSTKLGYALYAGDAQAVPGIDKLQLVLWTTVNNHWRLHA